MKSNIDWIRRGQRALRMLSELHRLGYQQLRGMPYLHPLGWRLAVAPKELFSRQNGAVIPIERLGSGYTAITGAGNYFDWPDTARDDARSLAEKFLVRFPDIAAKGKGRDWTYAGWLAELVGFLEQGDWLPAVEWEHMKGRPENSRFIPIFIHGKENLVWEGNESVVIPSNPIFPLPPL